jgi:hypothetical protein
MKHRFPFLAVLLFAAGSMLASTFIVPTDDELVDKSRAIATGTVEGSYVQETNGTIETIYEVRIEQTIKGSLRAQELVRVVTLGGIVDDGERGVFVPAEAKLTQGERVLLFLTHDGHGRWRTTDMTLGKFRFVTSTAGERMLVRDMEDVVGWDRAGRVYEEKVRREEGFLHFVDERVKGRSSKTTDYMVDASAVTLPPDEEQSYAIAANAAPFPPSTYTSWVGGQPVRWPNMSAGVNFYKRSDQNIAGAADGGVSAIQSGLAAWTNECGSLIVLNYAGQIAKASTNHDATNVVEFNDPQQRVSGSWGGSGTIAITFLSFAGDHQFAGGTWLNITDADVVFQDGFPATHAAFAPAMTHELGHGIGWRHSNQDYATGGACNSAVEECTSAAIMNSSVSANYGFTLQPWDINAAQSVYPGGTCGTCTPPAITGQPGSPAIAAGSSATLSVSATGTGPLSYQWFTGTSGNTASPIPGGTGPSITVTPASTTSYWVRVTNACGTANSATATVTVTTTPPPTGKARYDLNADGRSDIFWQHNDGSTAVWLMSGTTKSVGALVETTPVAWRAVGIGDFNGDGRADVFLRHSTGQNSIWFMNGATKSSGVMTESAPTNWTVAAIADFSGDGKADVFWHDNATGANAIWLMNGATKTTGVVLESAAPAWSVAGSGDFNADGRADILWRHTDGSNAIWFMNGAVKQSGVIIEAIPDTGWQVGGVGDFNADGRADILWRHANGSDSMWLMNGATKTAGYNLEFSPTNWRIDEVGDFNADGRADILWRDPGSGADAMWLMDGPTKTTGAIIETSPPGWRVVATR